jgi:hypothetical protein
VRTTTTAKIAMIAMTKLDQGEARGMGLMLKAVETVRFHGRDYL